VDRGEHPFQRAYFPPTSPTRGTEFLAPAADDAHPDKQKPLLLLVEDNEINLKVYLEDKFASYFPPASPVSVLTLATSFSALL
jgi:hypothetical protein